MSEGTIRPRTDCEYTPVFQVNVQLTKVVALRYGIASLSERVCGIKAPEPRACNFYGGLDGAWERSRIKDSASIIHPDIDTIRRDRILGIISNHEATRYSRGRQTGCSPNSR